MKNSLRRIVLILVIAEVTYLCLVNGALNLPLTQSLINMHRPEKYAVHWDSAWSWYPTKIAARGVSVNGQTSSQQWQADVSEVSASLTLSAFFRRTVRLDGVEVQDVVFRLRPRPKPEKDYAAVREFFPLIEDRDRDSPAAERQQAKEGAGWKVQVDGINARGSHDIWVFQVRAIIDGHVGGNLILQSKGGLVSLSEGETDFVLRSLTTNRDWEVSSGGSVKGTFELAPLVPADNPGVKALGFLTLDADVDAPVNSLSFLDFYLREFNGIELDGRGRLQGRLVYRHGDLTAGTNLKVSADELALNATPYAVAGEGGIDIAVVPEDAETLRIGILFGSLNARHHDDQAPLFTGTGLNIRARGSSRILLDEARETGRNSLKVTIPSVQVPDLRLYQRYIPAKWGAELKGGRGALQGEVQYGPSEMSAELYLASGDADLLLKGFRFGTNLDLGLRVEGGAADTASVDLSGTYLRLEGARLRRGKAGSSEPWQASLAIAQGTLGIPLPEGESGESGFRHLSQVFKDRGFKELLATANAQLKADLSVSDLGWVNLLFRNPFNLAISGAGDIAADLRIHRGWIWEGTVLRVQPKGLQVNVLDYVAQGKGAVSLAVKKGGETPDMRLDAKLGGGNLKRRGEDKAVIHDVALEVSALATGVRMDGGGDVAAIDLRILSARVGDMTVYNRYLPKDGPLRLLSGEADLTADVRLEPKSADGFVKLESRRLRSRLGDQEVAGELTLDIKLKDGVPTDMEFDISGSSLLLDRFKVVGGQKSFDQPDWNARFGLRKAHVVWKKPLRLDVEAEIAMKDSRPIVALFANQRGKNGWLDKILTVENVQGKAELKIASERALVPLALVGSDTIDVGVKGLIDGTHREGIFFARFRKLKGILKIKGEDRNFDILGARAQFDAYVPGQTPLKLAGGDEGQEQVPVPESDEGETDAADGSSGRGGTDKASRRNRGSYENFMGGQ